MAQTKVKLISDGVIDVGHLASGHGITTDNIGEGSNLYYTDARVSTYLSTNSYATESWVNANFLTTESDTLQSVVSRGSSVSNTITINGAGFEVFNSSFTNRRLTINQTSGNIPRIYNFDQVASSFHAIKIGGGNNDTTGLLVGDGNSPNTIVFGNLGIGTSLPSTKLQVEGSIRLNDELQIYTGTTDIGQISNLSGALNIQGTSTRDISLGSDTKPQSVFLEGTNGYLGIGTTTPDRQLEVKNSGDAWFRLNGAGAYFDFLMDGNLRMFNANGETMRITSGGNVGINDTSPTVAKTSIVSSDNSVPTLRISNHSDGGSGFVFQRWAYIRGTDAYRLDLVQEVSSGLVQYRFDLTNNSTTYNSNLVLDRGNVGIGISSPDHKLQVNGGSSNVVAHFQSTDTIGGIKLSDNTGNVELTTSGSSGFDIRPAGASAVFRVDSNGDVGIGTTSPVAKLHTNQSLQGSLLSYLNGTSTTFDGGANLLAVHNSPSIGSSTAAGLVLANNDKSVNAISPIIAFAAKSDSNTYNHTYAAIYGTRTGAGADSNWVVGDLVFATNYNTGPLERVRIKGGTGNVGINHTNPGHKLHILNSSVGSSFAKVIKLSCDPSVGGGNAIFFKTSGNDTDNRYGVKLGAVRSVNDNGSSEFLIQMESANMAGMENVFRINRDRKVIIGQATGYDGDLASYNGWVLNYTGGGGTTVNFSGSNEIFTFNQRDGQGTTQVDFRNGNVERGRIEWTTSATTYNTTSDYRLKENVVDLSESLSKLSLLQPKQFNFISDPEDIRIGFIAHEVQEVVPQAVSGEKDAIREDGTPKYQGLDHSMLVPLLVGAIKELKAEVEALKQQLNG